MPTDEYGKLSGNIWMAGFFGAIASKLYEWVLSPQAFKWDEVFVRLCVFGLLWTVFVFVTFALNKGLDLLDAKVVPRAKIRLLRIFRR